MAATKPKSNLRTLRLVLWALVVVALAGVAWTKFGAPRLDAVTDAGTAQLGQGDYRATATDGTAFTQDSLKGQPSAVFFGFTNCPDVCPTTLAELAGAQKQWEAIPDSLRPRVLFVSVDPERDTPARLGEYVHAFHKDTLAATADVPSLERFTTALGLVFQKAPGKNFKANPNDYSMDHSASIAVLDPEGRLAGLMRPPFKPQAIAADLKQLTEKSAP